MKTFPSVIIGLLLTCSATLLPSRAAGSDTSGATFQTHGSLTLFDGHANGFLTVNGQTSLYLGGTIPGVDNLTIFRAAPLGTTTLGTLTKNGNALLALTPSVLGGEPVLNLNPGAVFTAGGTLSLVAGSTVSFNGPISGITSGNQTYTGATLVANANTTLSSGIIVNTAIGSAITSGGLVKLGAGSLVLSGATTFNGGINSTVTNGILTFGNGGAILGNAGGITSGGVLQVSQGSILTTAATTALITNGLTISGVPSGIPVGGGTLTLNNNNNLTLNTGTLGAVLIGNPNTVGSTLILNASSTLNLGGTLSGNRLFPSKISLAAGTTLSILTTPHQALNQFSAIQDSTTGTFGTTTKFLDGVVTNGGAVSILYLPAVQSLASDPISIHLAELGTPGTSEKFVLQMTFDPTAAAALGDLAKLYLAWFDPADGAWKNAVDGNSDGGVSSQPITGAYDPTTDFTLGTYGVDTTNSTVWAVVDHDGKFGVASSAGPQMQAMSQSPVFFTAFSVPEPSTASLLVCGLAFLSRRSRKR